MAVKGIDYATGKVWRRIVAQAVPLTVAQLVHLLYNVVDRIFIGHTGPGSDLALAGVGLTFPIVTLIMAFTAMFGMGAVPLFSMARGRGDTERAGRIMGNSIALLLICAFLLTLLGYLFFRPVLYAFGASDATYVYAAEYLRIYLAGTVFSMIATGMSGFINAQGFPRIGMRSVVIGAVVNIALDPILIFALHMGVAGAALATVISQLISAAYVLRFLTGSNALIALERGSVAVDREIARDTVALGTSNFVVHGTNSAVQIICNATLARFGGDLYVGIMTVLFSVREIFTLPVAGLAGGSQPVVSFNYGAGAYDRVKDGIRFNALVGFAANFLIWALVIFFPRFWLSIFTDDAAMVAAGEDMLKIYFFGFVFMALQFAGQTTFQAIGDARHAVFFSLLRKVIIVIPLTLLLPRLGFGAEGVFLAEPISNVLGGCACFFTMYFAVYRKLEEKGETHGAGRERETERTE